MNLMIWLMRAKRWAANPPSARQVIFILSIVAACLGLAAVEWLVGWPAWLTPDRIRP
jgi:hypothetical protein